MSEIHHAGHRTLTSVDDSLAITIPKDVCDEKGIDIEDAGNHRVRVRYDADNGRLTAEFDRA